MKSDNGSVSEPISVYMDLPYASRPYAKRDGLDPYFRTPNIPVFVKKATVIRYSYPRRPNFKMKPKPILTQEQIILERARVRAIKKGFDFNLELSDIHIPEVCPYLGCKLIVGNMETTPSLDRIDSKKGYVKGNVMVISCLANRMKLTADKDTLVTFAKGVLRMHENP